MTTLAARVLEAIEETERLANGNEAWWAPPDRPGTVDTGIGCMTLNVSLPSYAAHIAHNDPAAVLRRCAADRKTVEHIADMERGSYPPEAYILGDYVLERLAEVYGVPLEQEET